MRFNSPIFLICKDDVILSFLLFSFKNTFAVVFYVNICVENPKPSWFSLPTSISLTLKFLHF